MRGVAARLSRRASDRGLTWADLGACAGVCACTAGYGALKLYWALGGSGGLREAPLPQAAIQQAIARDPAAVAGHWISVGLAVVGIGAALATVHPWGCRLPRWVLIGPLGALCVLMVLRAVLQAIGDIQRLLHGVSVTSAHTARWDLALWSPFFLLWGILWGVLVGRFVIRTRAGR
jgi:choline-glycine betaine transporter